MGVPAAKPASADTIGSPRMAPQATLVATPSLRYWRTQLAVPQRELAELASVSINTVQRLEAGRTARLTTIRQLAMALKVRPSDLMREPPASPFACP
jgi:DNA-binding Xre family transcriptional regulator